ncbi:BrnA antitoxin family protein [Jiella sonneratiae]|uniref:BrnA antitoxin family protein n=1 Tax=Jiella sonneratiae TaxID=2816856 RepID=A0ABS3J814_9HYPH|nr:BrnA antitoxin family protein [Jiella sonneratiae]MBO0905818.1 BrnA antitoxin family protein [Jiella sonneratiae]
MTAKAITRASLRDLAGRRGETRADAPEGPELGPEFWAKAERVEPRGKKSVHLRVDQAVYDYFKAEGPGHLTRMNAVLRAYVDAKGQG